MKITKFGQFINEEVSNPIDLYRLVAVPEGEKLVVDTENPGKYYFKNKKDADISVLSNPGKEYHIIKVTTSKSNIDEDLSAIESETQGCDCVVLKDDSEVEIENIEPFKK